MTGFTIYQIIGLTLYTCNMFAIIVGTVAFTSVVIMKKTKYYRLCPQIISRRVDWLVLLEIPAASILIHVSAASFFYQSIDCAIRLSMKITPFHIAVIIFLRCLKYSFRYQKDMNEHLRLIHGSESTDSETNKPTSCYNRFSPLNRIWEYVNRYTPKVEDRAKDSYILKIYIIIHAILIGFHVLAILNTIVKGKGIENACEEPLSIFASIIAGLIGLCAVVYFLVIIRKLKDFFFLKSEFAISLCAFVIGLPGSWLTMLSYRELGSVIMLIAWSCITTSTFLIPTILGIHELIMENRYTSSYSQSSDESAIKPELSIRINTRSVPVSEGFAIDSLDEPMKNTSSVGIELTTVVPNVVQ